jgi:hypothetical protein
VGVGGVEDGRRAQVLLVADNQEGERAVRTFVDRRLEIIVELELENLYAK